MEQRTTSSGSSSAPSLTEREKETLRLLLKGHDAKSIARQLQLSVHTVNERLRDARRKLGVASSREAARLFAEMDDAGPENLGDKVLGVAATPAPMASVGPGNRQQGAMHRLAWLSGGMFVMSLVIAAFALASAFHGNGASNAQAPETSAPAADASASMSQGEARHWLSLLDTGEWEASWRATASLFKSQISAPQWAAVIQPVRLPLGAASSRTFQNVTRTKSLPGVPAGDYEVLQFRTNFAHKPGAVETITLAREGATWKVAGYFIK